MNSNIFSKNTYSFLDNKYVPALVGREAGIRLNQLARLLEATSWPLFLTGPSGSGKTSMAMNAAKAYSQKMNVPAYYVQLSPEMTKTSLILGLRLVEGSLRAVDGVVADCMRTGGILIVDEAAHTTHELLLMFNSVLDRTSVTSIGDRIIYSKETFRVIFCSNDSSYAGNVRLPQSFAQRMVAFYYDYPSYLSECEITKKIVEDECSLPIIIPDSVINYIVSVLRGVRSDQYPLSARNSAIVAVLLNLAAHNLPADSWKNINLDTYFTDEDTAEAKRMLIASRILNKSQNLVTMEELMLPEITEFESFVSQIGLNNFRESFLSGCMYYLDVDGLELNQDTIRNTLANQII